MSHLKSLIDFDQQHIWHPYSRMNSSIPVFPAKTASGVNVFLEDGSKLIDGMSSWWAAIHGYNHPRLNNALKNQVDQMAHFMFGGITHKPAINLAEKLIKILPQGLDRFFFSDSGSIAIEVAMKMALQYWRGKNQAKRKRFLTIKRGYHGDTLHAMSVSDPDRGIHQYYSGIIPENFFADEPSVKFGDSWNSNDTSSFEILIEKHSCEIAAVILEPIVQGAGGMRFYHPEYLRRVHKLCDQHNILLILDEIATGFGRTGKLFACQHANIKPDIMCIGKALTGGYISLGATITTQKVSDTIDCSGPLMHGPTFMANPLACNIASESVDILCEFPWQKRVLNIENHLRENLRQCEKLRWVKDVRVLGAIGVIELEYPVDMAKIQQKLVSRGVWIRPFNNLIYTMPAYIIRQSELNDLTEALLETVSDESNLR